MKVRDIIREMPIQATRTIGNWGKNSSFRDVDRRILTNPKAIQKLHQRFANSEFNFVFYFVNSPEANRFTEVGLVTWEWVVQNMPKTAAEIDPDRESWSGDTITVIFTNNKAGEKYMMTPWIIAHRLGHGLFRRDSAYSQKFNNNFYMDDAMNTVLEHYFKPILIDGFGVSSVAKVTKELQIRYGGPEANIFKNFFQTIGTFKSARDRALRNPHEFWHECLAQFLLTGAVKFNPLPKAIPVSYSYGRPQYRHLLHPGDYDYYNDSLEQAAEYLTAGFRTAFNNAEGNIIVM